METIDQRNERVKVHVGAFILPWAMHPTFEIEINGKKTESSEARGIKAWGLLAVGAVECGDSLCAIGMPLGRGMGQPDGVRDYEARAFGKAIGRELKERGIVDYNIGENREMIKELKPWFSGSISDYRRGIDSVLN